MEEKINSDIIEKRKNNLKKFLFGWIEDNYDKAFIGILILAFVIRFLVFLKTMDQAIWWDTADYLATAKRWAGVNPNLLDTWYYRRGFFWPLFAAVFFKLGLGEVGLRFSVVLLSTGIVFVSYHLIKKMFNKELALLASIGLTFSWIFLFFTGRLLTNLPATFFLLTSLLLFWKGYVLKEGNKFIYFFGLFFALACLTRMQYLMFALPLLVFVFTKEKFRFLKNKYLWIAVGVFFLMFIPQLVMHNQHFGNPFTDLTKYYLGVGSSESGEVGVTTENSNLQAYFKNLPYILDANEAGYSTLFALSPIYLLFVIGFFLFFYELFLGFDKIFSNPTLQKKLFILVWIVSTFLFLGYIAPHLEQRYMMQTLPFLFLIAALPLIKLKEIISDHFKISKTMSVVIIVLLFSLLFFSNFNFGNSLVESKKTSYLEVKQAGEWLKENSNSEDRIITTSLPQNTYYSERITYPYSLKYRRDLKEGNETDLDNFIATEKPEYLVSSVFEIAPDWVYQYPEKHKDILTPVKVYTQGEQPVLIIYRFNYS